MTFVITQPCIDTTDKSCVEVCPVDCIHYDEGTDRMLYIDPVECIDCGACQPACPVSAIFPEGDVPADQQPFIEINTLWYQDKAAARAKVPAEGGAPAAAAPTPEAAPAPAAAAPAPEAEPAPAAAEAAPAAEAPAAAPAAPAAAAEPAPVPEPPVSQVPAGGPGAAPHHTLTPVGLGALAVLAACWYAMVNFPGPKWLRLGWLQVNIGPLHISGSIGATVVVLLPVALVALFAFLHHETGMLARFAARQPRRMDPWRKGKWAQLRRNEESRRYYQSLTVQEIAAQRFRFPSEAEANYRSYVNLPEPQLALEVGPGGDKLFPDIVVTRSPGNYPAMVAMVETRETVTREQAQYVWKRLENRVAPLYLYVPAGLAAQANDYARDVELHNYRIRTWRRVPGEGIITREL